MISDELKKLLCIVIRESAILNNEVTFHEPTDIDVDKLLGALDYAVHQARQHIDEEWRAARDRSNKHYIRPPITQTLEDLI